MKTTYRVGIIGRTGKGNYGHGLDTVWAEFPNVEVVAVAAEDEKGRADAAKRTRAKSAYADYREMLDKEKPDIVAVAPRWRRRVVMLLPGADWSEFREIWAKRFKNQE